MTSNESEITIPFAVHTAKYGYDWSSVPSGMRRDELDAAYRQAMTFKPEFMAVGDVVSGVFVREGRVVAFLLQIAKDWDSNGRDAAYDAFAFVPYAQAEKVDFGELLGRDEFHVPSARPPSEIRYGGPASRPLDSAQAIGAVKALCRHEQLEDFDFERIGAVIAGYGPLCEKWFFCRQKTAEGERTLATTAPQAAVGLAGKRRPAATSAEGTEKAGEANEAPARGADWVSAVIWILSAAVVVIALVSAFGH